jgi:hypothetical protein
LQAGGSHGWCYWITACIYEKEIYSGQLISIEYDPVSSSYCTRRGDDGVNAGTWELAQAADLGPIVANERPHDIGILGQIVLSKGRHYASWIK